MSEFGLQNHLDRLYEEAEHQFSFDADTMTVAQQWQVDFRSALRECLKITGRTLLSQVKSEVLSIEDRGAYHQEKHQIIIDDLSIPMYLLIPKTDPPYEPVMVFHGHGMGVNLILGNYADSDMAETYDANGENFAQRLAEDGYLVCAIEQQGFGERITDLTNQPSEGNSCRHLAFYYLLHNRTLLGERIWDAMNVISYVLGRDDVIAEELACVGFSGGGTTGLFLSALDERIQKTVIMGYLCTLKDSILGIRHCECNYVPNLLTLGETGDVAGLIAPRPAHFISGRTDPIFPVEGVREQYKTIQSVYKVFDVSDNATLTIHDGGHRPDCEAMVNGLGGT